MTRGTYAAAFALALALGGCQRSPQQKQIPPAPSPSQTKPKEAVLPAQAATAESTEPKKAKQAPKKRYVVAALGDSITDARSGGGGYLTVLREHCPQSVFVNFGKGGDMTNQMRRRLRQEILPQVPIQRIDTLLVYGGVNDLYSDLTAGRINDRIEEDLTGIYQEAREAGLAVVAVTVSPWGGFTKYWNPRRGENTRLLNSWIMGQVATKLVTHAVDSFVPLSCGNSDVLCPEYETRSHDGLHPGEAGHVILGEKLAVEAFANCL